MAAVLSGTVEIDNDPVPGSSDQARVLTIPALSVFGVSGQPDPYLSRVVVSDPLDTLLFKLRFPAGEISNSNVDPVIQFAGGRSLTFYYLLTGGSPINVDFVFIWNTDEANITLAYAGD